MHSLSNGGVKVFEIASLEDRFGSYNQLHNSSIIFGELEGFNIFAPYPIFKFKDTMKDKSAKKLAERFKVTPFYKALEEAEGEGFDLEPL